MLSSMHLAKMSTYQYTSLNIDTGEIRLLELHPGALDDPLKISIFTTPFKIIY
jgi:hypothetical protein